MSFILDALKKSENQRQQRADAEFSSVPVSTESPPAPRWLWILGALLVINIAVIAGLLLRGSSTVATGEEAGSVAGGSPASIAAPDFASRVETARRQLPEPPVSEPVRPRQATPLPTDDPSAAPAQARPAVVVNQPSGMATLPSYQELRANGSLSLPELHIDLHVFSETPGRSFVSINMQKYKENEALAEGPRVEQITREGVILEYNGTEFALHQ